MLILGTRYGQGLNPGMDTFRLVLVFVLRQQPDGMSSDHIGHKTGNVKILTWKKYKAWLECLGS